MTLDPTKLHIESHTPPIWEQEEDFSQIMSDQLRHAPWLAISILAHLIGGFVLYFALDNPHDLSGKKVIQMEDQEKEDEIRQLDIAELLEESCALDRPIGVRAAMPQDPPRRSPEAGRVTAS